MRPFAWTGVGRAVSFGWPPHSSPDAFLSRIASRPANGRQPGEATCLAQASHDPARHEALRWRWSIHRRVLCSCLATSLRSSERASRSARLSVSSGRRLSERRWSSSAPGNGTSPNCARSCAPRSRPRPTSTRTRSTFGVTACRPPVSCWTRASSITTARNPWSSSTSPTSPRSAGPRGPRTTC